MNQVVARFPGCTTGSFERNSVDGSVHARYWNEVATPAGIARVVAVDLGRVERRVSSSPGSRRITSNFSGPPVLERSHQGRRSYPLGCAGLHRGILDGIRAAGHTGHVDSVGIDSWGVDYGLLDADGTLLGNPVHYRDDRTRTVVEPVVNSVGPIELYRRSGIAVVPFNTIFQLAAGRDDAQFIPRTDPPPDPGPARILAYGIPRRRGNHRLNDPAAQSRRIRVGRGADVKPRPVDESLPADP